MIHSVIIVNNSGQCRLAKFYTPLDIATQQSIIKSVYASIISQSPNDSNILPLPDVLKTERLREEEEEEELQVVYRLYATLNFVFIFDRQESELGIYDLIQVFVESLNKCFANVCEIDLVFGWEAVESVLEDLIQGGLTLETNPQRVIDAVDSANGHTSSGNFNSQLKNQDLSFLRMGTMRMNVSMSDAVDSLSSVTSTLRSFWPGS